MKRLTAALATALVMGSAATALASPADQAPPSRPGPAAEAPVRPGPDRRPGDWQRPPRPPVDRAEIAMRLATRLSAAETLIGIRADQLDAWRAYTSALLDLFAPPPPAPPAGAGPAAGPGRAFAREEQMARRIQERAAKADMLLKAIEALKAKLTPEQIERLGQIDLRPHPPGPRGWRGHGPMAGDGPGPRPWARGPAMEGPRPPMAGPQDGPEAMPGEPAGPDAPAPDDGPDGMMAPDPAPDNAPPAP